MLLILVGSFLNAMGQLYYFSDVNCLYRCSFIYLFIFYH